MEREETQIDPKYLNLVWNMAKMGFFPLKNFNIVGWQKLVLERGGDFFRLRLM